MKRTVIVASIVSMIALVAVPARASAPLVSENFNGVTQSGWPDTDQGVSWTCSGNADTANGFGRIRTADVDNCVLDLAVANYVSYELFSRVVFSNLQSSCIDTSKSCEVTQGFLLHAKRVDYNDNPFYFYLELVCRGALDPNGGWVGQPMKFQDQLIAPGHDKVIKSNVQITGGAFCVAGHTYDVQVDVNEYDGTGGHCSCTEIHGKAWDEVSPSVYGHFTDTWGDLNYSYRPKDGSIAFQGDSGPNTPDILLAHKVDCLAVVASGETASCDP
jgi:hypothetical protein